jgi:YD repeat-containing protein
VTSITHTGPSGTLMSFAYTYDAAGNRTSVTKDAGNPESYTLDVLNRLTNVTYADGTTQAYTTPRATASRSPSTGARQAHRPR